MNTHNQLTLLPIRALIVLALFGAGSAAHAQTGSFFISVPGSMTPINTLITSGPGQVINLSVYFQVDQAGTTFDPNSVNALLGFDQTTTEGTSATPLDNLLELNGTTSTAISNVNSAFVANPTNNTNYGALGGGQSTAAAGTTRPYGADLFFNTGGGAETPAPTSPTHLFDVSIMNENLSSGSETVTVYNGGTGGDFTTFVTDGTTIVRPSTYTLTISAAPEPAESVTIGLLALGVGGLLLRARKRSKES